MTESFLRRSVLILGAVALAAPLVVSGSYFFPFITGKGFFFRSVVEVMVAVYVVLAFAYPRYRPSKTVIMYALGAIVCAGLVATLFAVNPEKSFWSNFERMEGYVAILHYILYAAVLGSTLIKEEHWNWLFRTSLAVASTIGLYGLVQVVANLDGVVATAPQWSQAFPINQGGVRLDGTFGNAAYLAVYALIHVFLGVWFMVRAYVLHTLSKRDGVLGVVTVLLSLLALYFSATRGAFLGLAVGAGIVLVALALGKRGVSKRVRAWAMGVLVVGVVLSALVFALRDMPIIKNDPTLARITSINLTEGTTRFALWDMALKGFAERPITGWGFEGFNYVFYKYYDPSLYAQEPWFDRAHNVFLDWLVAGGVIGFIAYLALYGASLYAINRGSGFAYIEKVLLSGLVVGYGINNIFIFDNLGSYLMFFTLLAYIHMRRGKGAEWSDSGRVRAATVAPVAVVLLVVVWWGVNAQNMAAASTLRAALAAPDIARMTSNMTTVLSMSTFGTQEGFEQALQTVSGVVDSSALRQEEKAGYVNNVLAVGDRLLSTSLKGDARILVLYASTLRVIGENEKADQYIKRALAASPNKQMILFEYALNELSLGRTESAVKAVEQAFTSAPEYDEARIMYAAVLAYTGSLEKSDALLLERFDTVVVNNHTLLAMYVERGLMDRAIAIARLRVAENEQDPQNHLLLASLLNRSGDRAGSVNVLSRARDLFPQFKNEFTTLITTVQSGGTF